MNDLIHMSTQELDALLQAELQKKIPDGELVRGIIQILEEREKDYPVDVTPEIQAAWDKLQAEDKRRAERPEPTARSWVIQAVSVAAVIVLLICVIPLEVRAEGWWEKIARWTDSFFEFVGPGTTEETTPEYVFQTDNPGLQEVYDAVTELGVTVPVVPMWLPDGAELTECRQTEVSGKKGLYACFLCEREQIVYKLNILNQNIPVRYQKNESNVIEYESSGVTYHITSNIDKWIVVWRSEYIECVLSIICNEEIIYKVIDSIYTAEEIK